MYPRIPWLGLQIPVSQQSTWPNFWGFGSAGSQQMGAFTGTRQNEQEIHTKKILLPSPWQEDVYFSSVYCNHPAIGYKQLPTP